VVAAAAARLETTPGDDRPAETESERQRQHGDERASPSQTDQGKRSRDTAGSPGGPRSAKRLSTAGPGVAPVRVLPMPPSSAPFRSPPAAPSPRSSVPVLAPARTPPGVLAARTPPGVALGSKVEAATPASSGGLIDISTGTAAWPAKPTLLMTGAIAAPSRALPPPGATPSATTVRMPFVSPNNLAPAQAQPQPQPQPQPQMWTQAQAQMWTQGVPGMRWPHQPQWAGPGYSPRPLLPVMSPIATVVDGGQTRATRLPTQTQTWPPVASPGWADTGVREVRGAGCGGGGAKALRERLKRRLSTEKEVRLREELKRRLGTEQRRREEDGLPAAAAVD
jgi:hypothetical protein